MLTEQGMVVMTSTRQSDQQLQAILHETANWTVYGVHGVVLCEVASLKLAMQKTAELTARGREVVALMRRRPPEIVVLSGQVTQLANRLSEQRDVRGIQAGNKTVGEFDDLLTASVPVYREAEGQNAPFHGK
jgi:hypothetical protein